MKLPGLYIRVSPRDTAEIWIAHSPQGLDHYHISGTALWGEDGKYGPNIGDVDFTAEFRNQVFEHAETSGDQTHKVTLHFDDGLLKVVDENSVGFYGMNVTFEGTYRRAS